MMKEIYIAKNDTVRTQVETKGGAGNARNTITRTAGKKRTYGYVS